MFIHNIYIYIYMYINIYSIQFAVGFAAVAICTMDWLELQPRKGRS